MPYVRTRLGRWFYEERGEPKKKDAPAVILMHGYLFDGRQWKHQVEPLSEHVRTITIDGPGHGKSENPPKFSLEDHAEALVDVYTELKIDRAILIGLSWGGMTAMRFALAHKDKTAGLVLMDTNADSESLKNLVKYKFLLSLHKRIGVPMSLYRKEVAPLFFGARTLREKQDLVEETGRNGLGFDREGVVTSGNAVLISRKSILDKIIRIEAPTLVMCGTEDKSTPPDFNRLIASSIPRARFALIDNAGHMSALEEPEAVNREMLAFVRGIVL